MSSFTTASNDGMGICSQLGLWILERAYQGFLLSRIGCMDVLHPAELATAPYGCMLIIIPLAVTCSLMFTVQQCRAPQFSQVSQEFWQYNFHLTYYLLMNGNSWGMIRKQAEWQTRHFKNHSYLMASRPYVDHVCIMVHCLSMNKIWVAPILGPWFMDTS